MEASNGISYLDLAIEVRQTALYFSNKGVKKGDRVLVFVPMSIDLYRNVLALFYIGATAVFLDEWVSFKRLSVCCRLAECRAFIGTPKARLLGFFAKEIRQIPIKLSRKGKCTGVLSMANVRPLDTALITFTTGSTGIPKAANRSHDFLNEQFKALKNEINPQPQQVDMTLLPIVLFVNLGVGCTSVLANVKQKKPSTKGLSTMVNQMERYQVNRLTASPFLIKKLALYLVKTNRVLMSVDQVFTGGAPVFPTEAKIYSKAFAKANIKVVYGSTEVEPISSIDARQLSKKELTKGLPVGDVYGDTELRIISVSDEPIIISDEQDWPELELPEGAIGEIIVTGPHVLKSYFKNERAFLKNKITCKNRIWHRTGDSGFLCGKELFLTGRCNQLLHIEGRYLSPFIVENKLEQIPGVEKGSLMEIKGSLLLVIEGGITSEVLKDHLQDIPYDSIIFTNIPMDPRHHSKIDYESLKKKLSKEQLA